MWACSTNGKDGNAYETSVGEPDGKTLFGRPRHRWEANIKMDLKEEGFEGVNWNLFVNMGCIIL